MDQPYSLSQNFKSMWSHGSLGWHLENLTSIAVITHNCGQVLELIDGVQSQELKNMVVYHPHVSTKISLEQITNPTWRGPKIHLVPISRDFFCTSKKNVRNSRETIPAQQIETVKLENPMNCPIRYLWYQYSLLNWSIWLIMGYWLECSVISFPKTSSSDAHWTCDNRIIMPAWLSSYVNSIDQEIMQKQEMMDKHTMERLFLISFYRISSGLPMIKPYPSFRSYDLWSMFIFFPYDMDMIWVNYCISETWNVGPFGDAE